MSTYIEQYGEDVYNYLFEKGDLFLPISERWKNKLEDMGCPKERTVVHRMGIDTTKFQFSTREKDSPVQLLSVGRFVEKKGLEYAIKASAKVFRKHKNMKYRIVGDGPLRNKIEQLIRELDMEEKIELFRVAAAK